MNRLDRVRLLYNRAQTTARLVVRDQSDLDPSLVSTIDAIESEVVHRLAQDMTHCFIRAMSPIHVKCKVFLIKVWISILMRDIDRSCKYGCPSLNVHRTSTLSYRRLTQSHYL